MGFCCQRINFLGVLSLSVERNLYISILKLTKETSATLKDVKTAAKLPIEACIRLLQNMQNQQLLYFNGDTIEVGSASRLKIAVRAAQLGADIQAVSDLLRWQEFEEIAAEALRLNGYTVHSNVHFTQAKRRYEIDVVACRKPLVLCIDCKRWQHAIGASALKKIVEDQAKRAEALSEWLPNKKVSLQCTSWSQAKFVPAVLSLMQSPYRFVYEVPVVPVLMLQDFADQLPLHIDAVKFFGRCFEVKP